LHLLHGRSARGIISFFYADVSMILFIGTSVQLCQYSRKIISETYSAWSQRIIDKIFTMEKDES
jgi:hypothetical protein